MYNAPLPHPPPPPPLRGGGGGQSLKFLFYQILIKFRTKGFSRVLNTNPKLIFPYDPSTLLPPIPRWAGGVKISKFLFPYIFIKFGTKEFSRDLNTNPKLPFWYDQLLPPPLPAGQGGEGGGKNLEILVFFTF